MSKKNKRTNRKSKAVRRLPSLRAGLIVGVSLLLVGLVLIAYELISTWQNQNTTAATVPLSEALKGTNAGSSDDAYISGTPVQIAVPSVGIDLKVIPGYYSPTNNSWTLTRDNAQWGTISRPVNDKGGMTFIYAHYRKGVFMTLPKIKTGAEAHVKTDKGHTFTYRFRSSTITNPQDTSIFAYEGKPILVLQTCSGVWYQNRQLFVFDLVKVE